MAIVLGWIIFAVIVGVAASARGRNGFGFFLLSLMLSPLIGILFVMAMPNLKHEGLLKQIADRTPAPMQLQPASTPQKRIGGRSDRVTVDRTPQPFEPDGVFAGVPYRVADDGSIHAIMQGAMVRFRDFDKFTGALGTGT
jgi:hypothetical protein